MRSPLGLSLHPHIVSNLVTRRKNLPHQPDGKQRSLLNLAISLCRDKQASVVDIAKGMSLFFSILYLENSLRILIHLKLSLTIHYSVVRAKLRQFSDGPELRLRDLIYREDNLFNLLLKVTTVLKKVTVGPCTYYRSASWSQDHDLGA